MFRVESDSSDSDDSNNVYMELFERLNASIDERMSYFISLSRAILQAAQSLDENKQDQFYLAVAKKHNFQAILGELEKFGAEMVESLTLSSMNRVYVPIKYIDIFETKKGQLALSIHEVETDFYTIMKEVSLAEVRLIREQIANPVTVTFSLNESESGNINRMFAKISAERNAEKALLKEQEDKSHDFGMSLV